MPKKTQHRSSQSNPLVKKRSVHSIITCKKVVKIYKTTNVTVNALNGVDIDIAEGEMVAILGPSGCGNTT